MPRLLVAAFAGAALVVLSRMVPQAPLIDLPDFDPHFSVSVSLSF